MKSLRSPRALAALGALALALTVGVGTVAAAGPHGGGARLLPARGPLAGLPATTPSGTLTTAQAAALAGMADEEKLARDLYASFAAMYPSAAWDNIGAAESTHLAAIRTLLRRYGIADPTATLPAGSFASADMAALYATLLSQGSTSEAAGFAVGRTVELDDIGKLDAARFGVTAADVLRVYGNLRVGSTQHLSAFSRLLGM
jgi:hypothetical protein